VSVFDDMDDIISTYKDLKLARNTGKIDKQQFEILHEAIVREGFRINNQ